MITNDSNFNVYSLKSKKWEPFGFFSTDESVIFDREGNACYRYDS